MMRTRFLGKVMGPMSAGCAMGMIGITLPSTSILLKNIDASSRKVMIDQAR
jgi:hypothetical protein